MFCELRGEPFSFCATDRTILLSFATAVSHAWGYTRFKKLTEIENVPPSEGVQAQRRLARRAVLRIGVPDVFIEAGFMSDMTTRELQHPLSSQGMLEQFLTRGAFSAHKGPFAPGARAIGVEHAGHRMPGTRDTGHW